ncbi:MAG TPA: glycosyltransferase family 2 protein [Fimbriiglobus sp.]
MADTFITVIILTFNEKSNLPDALDSVVGWAREVFVVDSYSTDQTVDIALSYTDRGVRVVQHAFENYSKQWNWALSRLPFTGDWVLKLDADERVTEEFKREVEIILATAVPDLEGISFRRRIFFMNRPLNWGGVSQNHDMRMWRAGAARFDDRPVNEHALVGGKITLLKSFLDHRDTKSVSDWLDKHNRYSSLEARALTAGDMTGGVAVRLFGTAGERRMWLRSVYFRLPGRSFFYFLYRYLFRLGFLDGRAGFRYALLYATFLYWIDLKIAEYRATGKLPEVIWPPRGVPHPALAESELQKRVDAVVVPER